MKKLYAILLLFGTLTIIFGSIIVSGTHMLVHYINEPESIAKQADVNESEHLHDYSYAHEHDHCQHGSTLTFLIESFDYKAIAPILDDIGHLLQWIFVFPWLIEKQYSLLETNHPIVNNNSTMHFGDFYGSAHIDKPTPPPKFHLS
ncbi:hypothetical protein [Aureibacter tunicatorum]|uniref:Uncharacterized protein n=1 Tax=Aureibacter tunicatorum TaxID=866807 RepID=A0AAE4BS68_9BACT|nr:hypothetical protein [Aureibacter tunicatorum]MDR6238558.1 hypothetical protein [Aureibacter tunicatorum]